MDAITVKHDGILHYCLAPFHHLLLFAILELMQWVGFIKTFQLYIEYVSFVGLKGQISKVYMQKYHCSNAPEQYMMRRLELLREMNGSRCFNDRQYYQTFLSAIRPCI